MSKMSVHTLIQGVTTKVVIKFLQKYSIGNLQNLLRICEHDSFNSKLSFNFFVVCPVQPPTLDLELTFEVKRNNINKSVKIRHQYFATDLM